MVNNADIHPGPTSHPARSDERTPSHRYTLDRAAKAAAAERASRRVSFDLPQSQTPRYSIAEDRPQGHQQSSSGYAPSLLSNVPNLPHPDMPSRTSHQEFGRPSVRHSRSSGGADSHQHYVQQSFSQPLDRQQSTPIYQSRFNQSGGGSGSQIDPWTQQFGPVSVHDLLAWNSIIGEFLQYVLDQNAPHLSSSMASNLEQRSTTTFPGTAFAGQHAPRSKTRTASSQSAPHSGSTLEVASGASQNSPFMPLPQTAGSRYNTPGAAQSQDLGHASLDGGKHGNSRSLRFEEQADALSLPTDREKSEKSESGIGRPSTPVQEEVLFLPDLDSFAWSEKTSAWVRLSGLDANVQVPVTDHTAGLGEDDRYAQHYRGEGDRCDGVCTGCKHTHGNDTWCDEVSLLDTHVACDFCCDTGTQPCGTLIPHPFPTPGGDEYAIGFVPLPLHKRPSNTLWRQYGFWVADVHPEDRPSVPAKVVGEKKGKLQRVAAKIRGVFKKSTRSTSTQT